MYNQGDVQLLGRSVDRTADNERQTNLGHWESDNIPVAGCDQLCSTTARHRSLDSCSNSVGRTC